MCPFSWVLGRFFFAAKGPTDKTAPATVRQREKREERSGYKGHIAASARSKISYSGKSSTSVSLRQLSYCAKRHRIDSQAAGGNTHLVPGTL